MPKQIRDRDVMLRKLEYMHNNPLKRGYVDDPLHWQCSCARDYADQQRLVEVITDWA